MYSISIDISLANFEGCDNCGSKLIMANNDYSQVVSFNNQVEESNSNNKIHHSCDCNKYKVKISKDDQAIGSKKRTTNLLKMNMINISKFQKITNIQQLYSILNESSFFLLSLVPSNAPSLTGMTVSDNDNDSIDKSLLAQGQNAFTKLSFDYFHINDSSCFQSLHHLGIQKSFYEQKLAEEKLSDLAIFSIHAEDYQHLLSSDSYENWRNLNVIEITEDTASDLKNMETDLKILNLENKKSFKFYRSVSVGMNNSDSNRNTKNSYHQYMQQHFSYKHIKSSETLDSGGQGDKFNMPFLCKPSTRLINLVQECLKNHGNNHEPKEEDYILATNSSLFVREVFQFIFSCYNIDMYKLVLKGAICASAYHAVALNAINWLLINVSSTASLHDIMWNFVYSLSPSTEAHEQLADMNQDEHVEDGKNKMVKRSIRKESLTLDDEGSIINTTDVCQHPFATLKIAGESAESWVTEGLHSLIKSISNLLPLLPMSSSLQQAAIRCFGIDFQPKDHISLHECKVFSHISTILTRSSTEEINGFHQDYENKSDSDKTNECSYSFLDVSVDVTKNFELQTSSRQSMVSSLFDNSTETFWESGNEDRNKVKHISLLRLTKNIEFNNIDHRCNNDSHIKFICVYIDNIRDSEYRINQISFKIMIEKSDALKYCNDISNNVNLYYGTNLFEYEKINSFDIEAKFCGWLHCELSQQQSNEITTNSFKYLRVEFNGPNQNVRVRQLKVLLIADLSYKQMKMTSDFAKLNEENRKKIISPLDSLKIQTSNCEAETLRVFRLLTSQVCFYFLLLLLL